MVEIIGNLPVPAKAAQHRFVTECLAVVKVLDPEGKSGGVVGTANTCNAELYGWQGDILPHTDDKGFIYFMPLICQGGYVNSGPDQYGKFRSEFLKVGTIYRMDDRILHWTCEDGNTVCIFVGTFDTPDDEKAVDLIRKGLEKLSSGDYYGAPRAAKGFRVALHDECLILDLNNQSYDYKLLADAKSDDDLILTCGIEGCKNHAILADSHYPYFDENNRCADHIRSKNIDRI